MNIYQMYHANDCRFGFTVQRDSWGNTLAVVEGIEGVKEGEKIKGKHPYYDNPKVFARVFKIGNNPGQSKVSLLSCPGTYSYTLIE